jgi:hypothetical protein
VIEIDISRCEPGIYTWTPDGSLRRLEAGDWIPYTPPSIFDTLADAALEQLAADWGLDMDDAEFLLRVVDGFPEND